MVNGLSVVIPAYNEQDNIQKCVSSVYAVLKKTKLDWEIIVVNDGSRDQTGPVAKSLVKKIPHLRVVENHPNKGYGGALKSGFAAAAKDFIAFFPADNQFDFAEIHRLLRLQAGSDADIVSGIRVKHRDPLHRRFFRWGWNTLIRALFGYLATDVDCGFKLFRRRLLSHVNLSSNGAMIDTQLFAGSRARGLKIAETPLIHLPRTAGSSTGGNPKVIFRALRELLVFWWQLRQEILVERGKAVFRWEVIFLLLILLLAAFLRLYKIDGYMTFLGDEGRDVLVVRDMLLGRKFTLIGPGTSIGNMYLGPLYYYLMLLPLALANFSPVGPAVMVAFFGLATLGLLWWLGRQWFGRISALAVSALYAVSPTVITYSHSSWNPNIMPFFALLTMYGLWKVWRLGYWRWLVVSAVSFAFVLQSHYLGLLLVPTIVLFWFLAPKKPESRRYTLISLILFFTLMSPLLWFDMRHNWINFGAIRQFFTDRQTTVNLKAYKALPHLWPIWTDINSSLLAGKNPTLAVITAISLLSAVYLWFKTRSRDLLFVLIWLAFGLIGLGLYKQHIYDHYYGFLFPAPFLILGFIISSWRWLSLPLLVLLFTVSLIANPLRYPPNNQLRRTQEAVRLVIAESQNRPFNFALIAKRNYDKSYVYFLELYQAPYRTIHQQLTDQLFVVCEDPECNPIGHPLWEVAAFGWAKIDRQWELPRGVRFFKLVHNPTGK